MNRGATMLNQDFKDLTKHIYWNGLKRCYSALMAEMPTCRAEGSTPGEALANVERAYAQNSYPGALPVTHIPRAPSRASYPWATPAPRARAGTPVLPTAE